MLDHPNIVKYIDALRIDDSLNIVIEFVENGSLSSLLGKLHKHGHVEEQLVAVYTAQILEGLRYLHQQGVIHRDIKGANILSTKDGVVKLADFGVATKLNEARKCDSVVGTPYWSKSPFFFVLRSELIIVSLPSGTGDHRNDWTAKLGL